MKFFDLDSPLMRFLSKIADLFILNFLFLLCSIPIVTIGASTIALYTVTLKSVRNEESYIVRNFFVAFRKNLKIGLITWIIVLFFGAILFFDFQFLPFVPAPFRTILHVLTLSILFLYAIVILYLFPYIARFENTIVGSFKNAFLLAIVHLPSTILLAVIFGFTVYATLHLNLAVVIVLWLLIGFSGIAYINAYCFRNIFDKHEK